MNKIIDFDDTNTFPVVLSEWEYEFENMINNSVDIDEASEWRQFEYQLQNLHIEEMEIVKKFVKENLDTEIAVCHCARILDADEYWKNGIIAEGGRNSVGEERVRKLLININLTDEQIDEIFVHIYALWDRDKISRTKAVHFFIDKKQVYKNDQINYFAINVGGEIVRRSLNAINSELYKQEPYKRLWIDGFPAVIKFKCKLRNTTLQLYKEHSF